MPHVENNVLVVEDECLKAVEDIDTKFRANLVRYAAGWVDQEIGKLPHPVRAEDLDRIVDVLSPYFYVHVSVDRYVHVYPKFKRTASKYRSIQWWMGAMGIPVTPEMRRESMSRAVVLTRRAGF